MQHHVRTATLLLGLLAATGATTAWANENNGSIYPDGVENYMTGALPPPGVYGIVYGEHYGADRLNDAHGNNLNVPGLKVDANAVVPRFVWVTGNKLLGGDMVVHAIVPLVDLKVTTPGGTFKNTGLGDITLGLGSGYHYSPNFHAVYALDVFLPTGQYTKGEPSIGTNHSAVEPVANFTYIDPAGFNGDLKFGYLVNQKNNDTKYTSGDEFHLDYSAGWGLGNGWVAGVGGYVYQQLSDDKQNGATVADSKAKAMAIGPSVKYDSGKGWFVTAKWQKEVKAENHFQGNALWLKAVFPF